MKVLILAAGYGTRLKEIAKDTPKPLLEVANKPLIDHILDRIENLKGLNEVLVVTNDKFFNHFSKWAKEKSDSGFSRPIRIVNDGTQTPEDRLGSVGDIDFVIKNCELSDDLLVVGGDNLFDYNVDEYVEFAQKNAQAITIGLYDIENLEEATKFGVVAIDEKGKVSSFEEKPDQPKSTLISMCFYYMPKNSLGLIGNYLIESNKSDKAGEYVKWLTMKHEVYGFKFQGEWYDIGSIESYQEAQSKFK